jgi:hypothetical protein
MLITIECDRNKADISNLEIGENFINFSLLHFFHLDFKDEDETRDFFMNLIKHSKRQFSNGQSYVEMDDSLIMKKQPATLISGDANPRAVRMYRIINNPVKNCIEIDFYLDNGNIGFFLYQDLIEDIKSRIMM